ncbi:HutD family protein [Microbacterium sp.]|uniref:HutD/Ves family protein n=1 Tax=Microbacterium sp. TaxID=51671 RepID=UPI003A939265
MGAVRKDADVPESAATLIRFADRPATSWANGRGTTVVLWRTPDGDSVADVRLSIATVSESGPFSLLPGIDRMLMPLAAGGLTLRIDGSLFDVARYEVVGFAGEAETSSVDVSDAGHDLNLMVRRGIGSPRLESLRLDGPHVIDEPGLVAVVALSGDVRWNGATLGFGDTVLVAGASPDPAGEARQVELDGTGVVALVGVSRAA